MKKLLSFVVCMCIILSMTAFASESSLDDGLIFSADFDRANGYCQAVQLQTDGGVLSRGFGTIKSNGLSGDSLTGKAYRADATPQGLAFANGGISKLISGQPAATVSVWVKFDAVHDSAKRENIMLVHINGATVGCELYTQSGWLYASSRSQNGKGMKSAKYMPEAWEKDAWYHIIASFDYENKAITLYVNGEKAAENTNAAFETNVFTAGTVTVYDSIGLNHKATGTTDMNRLNGSVDDFRLYNRALTADEVSALYQKQYGEALESGLLADIDFEQRNSDGEYLYRVLENGVMTVKSTGAVRLAETEGALGTGKAARMMWYGYECGENVIGKALDGAENAAFSLWVKLNSIPTGSERQQLFLVTVNGASAGLEAYAKSNGFVFAGRSQATDKWQSVSTAEMTLNPGQWYHVAGNVSFKHKQFEIYVDGVKAEKTSVAFGADTYTNVAHTKNDYLGVNAITRTPSGVYKLDGIMENFRVYNRRLTEEEIGALGKPVMLYMTKEDNSVIADDSASADDKITFFAQAPELGGTAKLIIAVYDSNGSLTRAEVNDIAEEGVFAEAGALSAGDTVKGFIWKSMDGACPVTIPRVLAISE